MANIIKVAPTKAQREGISLNNKIPKVVAPKGSPSMVKAMKVGVKYFKAQL